jgi:hypothetical protein
MVSILIFLIILNSTGPLAIMRSSELGQYLAGRHMSYSLRIRMVLTH